MVKMEKLMDALYPTNLPEFMRKGTLRECLEDVFATNLMNFNDKLALLGTTYMPIHRAIIEAEKLGISLAQLKEYSRIIKEDFVAKNPAQSDVEKETASLIKENNRLVAQLCQKIADLTATIKTQEGKISSLETQLQQEQVRAASSPSPRTSRRRASSSPVGGRPTSRARIETSSPGRIAQAAAAAGKIVSSIVGTTTRAAPDNMASTAAAAAVPTPVAATTSAIAPAAIFLRSHAPTNAVRQKKKTKSSGKKTSDSPLISSIVRELALNGSLKSNTPYPSTEPPPVLFPHGCKEKTKYKDSMRVVAAVVTKEQEEVFRAKEPDQAHIVVEGEKLDLAVRQWLAEQENVRLSNAQTARMNAVGRRAAKLPETAFPTSRNSAGGLWSGLGLTRRSST